MNLGDLKREAVAKALTSRTLDRMLSSDVLGYLRNALARAAWPYSSLRYAQKAWRTISLDDLPVDDLVCRTFSLVRSFMNECVEKHLGSYFQGSIHLIAGELMGPNPLFPLSECVLRGRMRATGFLR